MAKFYSGNETKCLLLACRLSLVEKASLWKEDDARAIPSEVDVTQMLLKVHELSVSRLSTLSNTTGGISTN